jgi:energy-coupling factor transport system permease protein
LLSRASVYDYDETHALAFPVDCFHLRLYNPGRYLSSWPVEFSPTYEGIQQGVNQILRISLEIAGIAILMASSTREALMVGMYCLLKPLKLLNLSAERFTARLYLTLHYMDRSQTEMNASKKSLNGSYMKN